jgi:hypothetical protein
MTTSMTHLCCPSCRWRFTPAAAAYLPVCPQCGEPPQAADLQATVGFRLFRLEDMPQSLPEAIAASLLVPDPHRDRS